MDIDNLRLLIEVVRRGSFAAVARDRNVDPSWVSRVIAGLEDELGFRLLQRTTRRMTVTEAGDLYLQRIEGLIEELDQARDAALTLNTDVIGTLRLTCSVAFGQVCIVPLLAKFKQDYPTLKVELILTDATLDLVAEQIDLAIRLGPRFKVDIIRVKLFNTRYRVCASPEYIQAQDPLRHPQDLQRHNCLRFNLPHFRSEWMFKDPSNCISYVNVGGDVLISNALALRECARAGLGPALLANWLIDDDLASGQLVDLFPDYSVTATDFETAAWILYPSRTFLPRKVQVTIDFLKQHYAARYFND